MDISYESFERWMCEYLPSVFYTTSSKSPFFIQYESSELSMYKFDKKVSLSSEDLFEVSFMIFAYGEVDKFSLKSKFKYWNYYLPIALFFLEINFSFFDYKYASQPSPRPMGILDYILLVKERKKEEKVAGPRGVYGSYFDEEDRIIPVDIVDELEFLTEEQLDIIQQVDIDPRKAHRVVPISFATNRKKSNNSFSGEVSSNLSFGLAEVSIPLSHEKYRLERPLDLVFFRLKERKEKHFVLDNITEIREDSFYQSLKGSQSKQITIFIHGYNVTFEQAVLSAAQFKEDVLGGAELLLYSWPSRGKLLSYDHDRENAIHSSKYLAQLLRKLSKRGFEEVFVIAHSMGTFCLSESLQSYAGDSGIRKRALLAASDVASRTFIDVYAENFKRTFEKTAIYASSKDWALKFSKVKSDHPRVGDANPICVVDGIETIDVSRVDHQFWGLRHSYHSKHESIIEDLKQYILQGIGAGSRGLVKLQSKDMLDYWTI